ncbi:MAG: archaeosortase/exosortase family protein [Verrucomicrobia bacterium]|nr:archaeosortase/exosortase family protein [Verrucomicrobiota bacterium]
MKTKQDLIEREPVNPEVRPDLATLADRPAAPDLRWHGPQLALLALAVIVGFSRPLRDLLRFAGQSELFSHVALIPFVSLYLAWTSRHEPIPRSRPHRLLALGPLIAGCGVLLGYWLAMRSGWKPETADYLAVMMFAAWLFLVAGVLVWLGTGVCRALAFPLVFLLFMVPFPDFLTRLFESGLQRGSADTAHAFFWMSGTPVFRQGLDFQLPGFAMQVAPECSGIHSSLALLITSVLAGRLFLSSPWNRTLLTLFVIPLGLVRNGFRIFVIGELCVHFGRHMIDSAIHRRGGPVFFALSLIPFLLLLLLLRKWEGRLNGSNQKGNP